MGALNPLGWGTMLKDGKTFYTCGPESTPSVPKIKCDLLPGWEHKLSMSTGKRYYLCRAGNGGNGFSQWSAPTEPCTEKSQKKETRANASVPSPITTPTDPAVGTGGQTLTPPTTPTITTPPQTPRPLLNGEGGRGIPPRSTLKNATTAAQKAATTTAASTNAAVGAAVSKLAPNADTIHVTVQTPTGSEGFNVKPTAQAGGRNRYNKTRRNKNRNNRNNRKNKSKRNRNRNNRK
jgi:hypothetical protein